MKKDGIKEAAKLLSGLDYQSRANVLEIMAKHDPVLTEKLRNNLVALDDLCYLTEKMLQELLREIDLKDLGLALRIAGPKLCDHILSIVSRSIKSELNEVLRGDPQPVSQVNEAADRILAIVKRKVEKGELILDKDGSEKYV